MLSTAEAKDWLESSVDNEVDELIICSAYIKNYSLEYFYNRFIENKFNGTCKFLSRWLLNDLIQGSSDLEVYTFLAKRKIPFYIKNDFHGKLYYLSNKGLLMGSPNFTSKGLGLIEEPNDETSVILHESDKNYQYINNIFANATLVSHDLFEEIMDYVKSHPKIENQKYEWPENIKLKLKNDTDEYFLVDEWFHSSGLNDNNSENITHDISLLGANDIKDNVDELKKLFCRSKPYRWLISNLKKNNFELRYGTLSENLHNTFSDVPPPFRKYVKHLLSNLLAWIRYLDINEIMIEQYNISQLIKLKTN